MRSGSWPLAGKEVWPFATNGGWLGHTMGDFKAACPGAKVGQGLDVRFDGAAMRTAEKTVLDWAGGIGRAE